MKEEISFASVLKNPIYKNRDAIYAMNPATGLVHRTEQKNELVMELAPILMNSPVTSVFVYGNPGTGVQDLSQADLVVNSLREINKEVINKF